MIPSLPAFFDMVYTLDTGRLAPDGYLYNDQMFQALNLLVNMFNVMGNTLTTNYPTLEAVGITAPELIGIVPPSFTTAQITALMAITPSIISNGAIWYNSTLKKLQFKADTGVVETITST